MPRVNAGDQPTYTGSWTEHEVKDKRGRYLYKILDRNTADVMKSADALTPAYEIRDGICSCLAAQHSKLCKHVKTVQHLAAS